MARESVEPMRDLEHDQDIVSPEEQPSEEENPRVVARRGSQRSTGRSRERSQPRPYSGNRGSRRQNAEFPSNDSIRSSRPLRFRDERWDEREDYDDYDDHDRAYDRYLRDEGRHPDFYQDRRSRMARPKPPRTYLNRPAPPEDITPPGRQYPEESRYSTRGPISPMPARQANDEGGDAVGDRNQLTYKCKFPDGRWIGGFDRKARRNHAAHPTRQIPGGP